MVWAVNFRVFVLVVAVAGSFLAVWLVRFFEAVNLLVSFRCWQEIPVKSTISTVRAIFLIFHEYFPSLHGDQAKGFCISVLRVWSTGKNVSSIYSVLSMLKSSLCSSKRFLHCCLKCGQSDCGFSLSNFYETTGSKTGEWKFRIKFLLDLRDGIGGIAG